MKIVFSDFDGTLTQKGKIGPLFFNILDLVHSNGAEFVVVSGRSISWGHFLLTHFPLEAALMEGGGVILLKDQRGNIIEDTLINEDDLFTLDEVTIKLMTQFPDCPLSADTLGRKTDRAIEWIGQDETQINEIKKFLKEEGMSFTQSDVHINFWVGEQTKYNAIEKYMARYKTGISYDEVLYFGDSMNDESVFERLPHTVGVSNISKVLNELKFKPRVVLNGEENLECSGVYSYLKDSAFNF